MKSVRQEENDQREKNGLKFTNETVTLDVWLVFHGCTFFPSSTAFTSSAESVSK